MNMNDSVLEGGILMDHTNIEYMLLLVLSSMSFGISFYAWRHRFIYGLCFFWSMIFVGIILELVGIFKYSGWNITTIGLIVVFLGILVGVSSLKFFDLVSVAKNVVFESMEQGVIVLDARNRILDMNNQLESMLHIKKANLVGTFVEDVPTEWLRQAIQGDSRYNVASSRYSNVMQYGEAHYEVISTPLVNGGNIVGRIVVLDNITSSILAEQRLKQLLQSEEKLLQTEALAHMMFNHHQSMMLIMESTTGHILEANAAAENFYQLPLVGRSFYEFNESKELAETGIRQYLEVGEYHFATRHQFASGAIKDLWVHLTTKVVGDMRLSFSILEDVTEKLQLEKELREAKEKAESANQAKDDFLAIISHELRTPMNGILGMATLILGTNLSNEQRECLELVQVSGEKLLGLLNDLLDFAKVRDGKLDLEIISFSLRDLMKEFNQIMGIKARKKGLQCMFHIDYDVPELLKGDPRRLQQILMNLADNAIKFTKSGLVAITISVKQHSDNGLNLLFSVKDTGIGIPQEKVDIIFHKFTQVDSSTTRKYGGTGLGLSIVKHLVERMGGIVWVESSLGRGSSFYFTVNFGICQNVADRNSMDYLGKQRKTADKKIESLHILLVEDEFINQKVALKMLKNQGHVITLAENGIQAVELFAAKQQFDIIFMDIQMPDMDGIQATAAIRQMEEESGGNGHIPIVAMTAYAMKGDRERLLSAGMDEYISKPLNLDLLFSILARVLPHKHVEIAEMDEEREIVQEKCEENNYLEQLMDVCQGDVETVGAVISCFLENGTQYLTNIEQAIRQRDAAKLKVSAHRLKGAAAYFGNQTVVECAAQLEVMGRTEQLMDMQIVFGQLQIGMKNLELGLEEAWEQLKSNTG